MKEMNSDQVDQISGGGWPLAGLAIFIYHERNEIGDFVGGFLDGFNDTNLMKPE